MHHNSMFDNETNDDDDDDKKECMDVCFKKEILQKLFVKINIMFWRLSFLVFQGEKIIILI